MNETECKLKFILIGSENILSFEKNIFLPQSAF